MNGKKIHIFDTTLRDGQQCPGAAMSFEHNMAYAHLAAKVGVDVLEAGFPAASKLDFDIVQSIATEVGSQKNSPIIAALTQLREEQIDRTIEALTPAVPNGKGRLHVYVPVDPHLMAASLGEKADFKKIITDTERFITKAVGAGLSVEFSPEGYSRMAEHFDFVTDLIRAAVSAGAAVVNCPDTTGAASRFQGDHYFVESMKKHAAIIAKEFPTKEIIWSVHCHNDFGLALDNSIEGVFRGPATQIEGCINGIGERAGNVSLEQCIMVVKHFGSDEYYTDIKHEYLKEISDFVAKHMLPRQPHSPVCGDNAAKHSSGGHTNAVLKNPTVYQGFDPKEVGMEVSLLFGPLSGGNHAQSIIMAAGFICAENEKAPIAQFIKNFYSERRKGITDAELVKGYIEYRKPIKIESFDYARKKDVSEVILRGDFFDRLDQEIIGTSTGRDSALATLKKLVDEKFPGFEIANYQSESVGEGISALSQSTIIIQSGADSSARYEGIGRDHDIEISAMKALLDAVNVAYVTQRYRSAVS